MKNQLPGGDGYDHGNDPGQDGDDQLLELLIDRERLPASSTLSQTNEMTFPFLLQGDSRQEPLKVQFWIRDAPPRLVVSGAQQS
jgi:hypothetical protein